MDRELCAFIFLNIQCLVRSQQCMQGTFSQLTFFPSVAGPGFERSDLEELCLRNHTLVRHPYWEFHTDAVLGCDLCKNLGRGCILESKNPWKPEDYFKDSRIPLFTKTLFSQFTSDRFMSPMQIKKFKFITHVSHGWWRYML